MASTNITFLKGASIASGSGPSNTATMRVAIASDDINLNNISSKLEDISEILGADLNVAVINDADIPIGNSALTKLDSSIVSNKVQCEITNSPSISNAGLTSLNNSIISNKVQCEVTNSPAFTNSNLTSLGSCIVSNRVQCDIPSSITVSESTSSNLNTKINAIHTILTDIYDSTFHCLRMRLL